MPDKNKIFILIFTFSILLNISFFYVLVGNKSGLDFLKKTSALESKYPFLSRRILASSSNDILLNFLKLRQILNKQTEPYKDSFGVYFEYLPTGTSIGVNSTNEFYSASLFKTPIIMAYYHYLERTGKNGEDLIIQKEDINKNFGDLWKRGAGAKISSEEAVKLALSESDNTAARVIARRIQDQDFQAVYDSLGVDFVTGSGGAIISTRDYSTILKALYFSSVLNRDDSNKILKYLSESQFNDKLVAGLPSGTLVAHKIGDYRDEKNNQAYTDCGIVYLPQRPYMLCMLSVGDENTARERMSKLSKTIFDYVSTVR